ncbi:MAG: hypothetical protein A2289_10200 [Deltaproteobacteria bacterium RIFOXYA12_FULL_58_15]|nr:MAG: hypothetical protein A2289_10200 [Deltaproteobacteria bacterium RIFOXYA12_FULL_58_15]
MQAKQTNKLIAVVAVLTAVAVVAALGLGLMEENIVPYWTPSELLTHVAKGKPLGSTVRLGGMVQKGTMKWDDETLVLSFALGDEPDSTGSRVTVVSNGVPPQMFREGIGCIVEGAFNGQVFHSNRLMVKHSNEYQPPKDHEDPRRLYRTLLPEQTMAPGAQPPVGIAPPQSAPATVAPPQSAPATEEQP